MAVAVIGCGRSGTNLVLEILRGSSKLVASKEVENKKLCRQGQSLVFPNNYLTKCDTTYFDRVALKKTLDNNPNMKVIWTMRDPRDMILSKIRRGQPRSQGGDGSNKLSDDATPEGCIKSIEGMYKKYHFVVTDYPKRIKTVRMEGVIRDVESETKRMCLFLGIPFERSMVNFIPRMRNKDKARRYKDLDRGQLELWKKWEAAYDGFFSDGKYPIQDLFKQVDHLVKALKYE